MTLDSLEGSVSPKVISSYQTLSELQKASGKMDSQMEEKCRNSFKGSLIRWGITKSHTPSLESAALSKLFHALGVANPEPFRFENREAGFDSFTSGKTAVHLGSSGLWALDPFGDLQMFFTPNLHKSQYFSSQGSQMQDYIAQLRRADSPSKRKDLALLLNQHIFNSSLFFVYAHSRRFFIGEKGSSLERIPMAISGAAPWQVFAGP